MSWAATFPLVGASTWHRLVDQIEIAAPVLPDKHPPGLEAAMAVLAMCHRQRFEELGAALGKTWRHITKKAIALADDLAEAQHGQLHSELETLRRELQ